MGVAVPFAGEAAVGKLAEALMVAVVRTGAVEKLAEKIGKEAALTNAVAVMRAELKALIAGTKYANERALIMTGGTGLAWAAFVATVVAAVLRSGDEGLEVKGGA